MYQTIRAYAMYVASGAQQCTEMLSCVLPRQVAEGKSAAAGGRYSKTHTYIHIAGYCAESTVTMASNHIKTKNIAAASVYTCTHEYLDSSERSPERRCIKQYVPM